jgi:glycerol-3-phosphate O-acyltransferase
MAARRATLDRLRKEADLDLSQHNVIEMGWADSEYGPHKNYYEAIGEAVKPLVLETLLTYKNARYMHVEVFGDTSVYLVRAEQRIVVERYKNSVIHGLVRECLLAMAVCRALETRDVVRRSTVETDCATLSRLLKYEFVYDPGETFSESFTKTWDHFLKMGWLESDGSVARMPKSRAPVLQFFRRGLIKFVESYHLVCVRAAHLDQPTEESDFILQAIREGEKRYSAGELYAREACSTVTMKNALMIFEEMGAIRRWKEGRKSLVQLNGEVGLEILNNFNSHMASWTLWR